MTEFIELDGSVGEGGGQVLRVALALSAILNKPLHITNIRRKRQNPGLRNQHLTAVKAVQQACSAEVRGAAIGSTELFFIPNNISASRLELDTGTAGSTMLVLQSLLPVLFYAPKPTSFKVRGGTNNPNAPSYEYFAQVFIPAISMMGAMAELRLVKRGFYPRGGGIVEGLAKPVELLQPVNLTKEPRVTKIVGKAFTSRLPSHVAERMASSCIKTLKEHGYNEVEIERESLSEGDSNCAMDPGAGIVLVALCEEDVRLGVDRLGERGVPAETVGREAALDLIAELGQKAAVDRHLGDMLVIYASLAKGRTTYTVTKLTSHTLTSLEVCRAITGCKTHVRGDIDERGVIEVEGIGFRNPNL